MKNYRVKLLACLMAVMMLVSMMPAALAAAGTVTVLPVEGGNTPMASISHDRESTPSYTFVNIEAATVEKSPEGSWGRQNDWYVGVKVTAPSNIGSNAKYSTNYAPLDPDDPYTANTKSLYNSKDGADYIELWPSVNKQMVENYRAAGIFMQNTYAFDWNGDDIDDYYVYIVINPYNMKLLSEDGSTVELDTAPVPAYDYPAAGGSHSAPKTGDSTPIALLAALLVASALGMTIMRRKAYR